MKIPFLALVLNLVVGFFASAQITYPTNGAVWYPRDDVIITWSTNNISKQQLVAIYLTASQNAAIGYWPQLNKAFYVAYYTVWNTAGKFKWTVPEDTTSDRSYRIEILGIEPDAHTMSPDFQVRFGKKRGSGSNLKIEPAVYLSWPATYGVTYEIENSTDLETWTSIGTVVADDEDLGVTVLAEESFGYFRLREVVQ